ncbi:unnamed protein product [Rhizophagus irregularis]|nr:unnamed protein product [Rhizophagus irregularis]
MKIQSVIRVYCEICNNESKTFPYEETFEESKRFGEIEQYIIDIFKDGNHNSIKDLIDHEKSCEEPRLKRWESIVNKSGRMVEILHIKREGNALNKQKLSKNGTSNRNNEFRNKSIN